MDTNDLNMEVKHRSSKSVKLEEETDGVLSKWAKTALESFWEPKFALSISV